MGSVIKSEIKKNFKTGVVVVWILSLLLAYLSVGIYSIESSYADLFSKYPAMAPFMGLLMFMMFSGSFITEYNSNMVGLIKSSKNGKRQFVISKFLAAGISASIVNLSILLVMSLNILTGLGFKGLDTKLNKLWYFSSTSYDITVIEMILILIVTVILGSFVLAAIGLFFSSISTNAIVPFLIGIIVMGVPYIMVNRTEELSSINVFYILTMGMYSSYFVKYSATSIWWILYVLVSIILITLLYILSKKKFLGDK